MVKWVWKKLTSPLANTLTQTPDPLRYKKYHEISGEDKKGDGQGGVSYFAAICLAVNLLMGSGFLALPALVYKSGLILGPLVLIVGAFLMKICVTYEAEAMCRAEAITHYRLNPREGVGDGGGAAAAAAAAAGAPLPAPRRAWTMAELTGLFGGRRLQALYCGAYAASLVGAQISYATVFATSMSSWLPIPWVNGGQGCSLESELYGMSSGCNELYIIYTALFALIVVPISLHDIKEQVIFQMIMTYLRFALVIAMVGTTVYASYTNAPIFGSDFQTLTVTEDSSAAAGAGAGAAFATTAPLFDWTGTSQVLSAAVFSLTLNSYLPILVEDMKPEDKRRLGGVVAWGTFLTCAFYVGIGTSVAYYFGGAVAASCNVNWAGFRGGAATADARPLWASALALFVVTFPTLDVLSVYPLNAVNIAKYLMALVYGERIDKAETDRFIVRFFRLMVGLPPIAVALWASNFTVVLVYAGITAIPMSMIVPPYLARLSRRAVREELRVRDAETPYSGWFSGDQTALGVAAVGVGMLVLCSWETTRELLKEDS